MDFEALDLIEGNRDQADIAGCFSDREVVFIEFDEDPLGDLATRGSEAEFVAGIQKMSGLELSGRRLDGPGPGQVLVAAAGGEEEEEGGDGDG